MIKITSDMPGRIKVTFPYNLDHIARIKSVGAHRWHPEETVMTKDQPFGSPV